MNKQVEIYNFISDEEKLKKFIESLEDTKENEKYLVSLFARKKYDKTGLLKSDKSQVKRFLSTKENLVNDIKKLQVEKGLYTFDGQPIPEDSFVLYINPTPRDLKKAYFEILKEVSNSIYNDRFINVKSMMYNCVHKSRVSGGVYDVDLDLKEEFKGTTFEDINKIIEKYDILPFGCYDLVKTRGGFHVMVKLKLVPEKYKKSWHLGFRNLLNKMDYVFDDVMMNSDGFIPIAGTLQGGKEVEYEQH